MSTGRGYHGPKDWARDQGDAVGWALRTLAQVFGAGFLRPDWRSPGWRSSHQWRPVRRNEPRWFANAPPRRAFPGTREPGYWRPRYFREERRGSNWQRQPPCSAPAIGGVTRCLEEARPLRRSRCPAGTGQSCRMRGGLVGMFPEALCAEAPKGQPVICRESLMAVCVEDPQGHPMIHGCRRHHSPSPCGKPMRRRAESGPPS